MLTKKVDVSCKTGHKFFAEEKKGGKRGEE